MTPEHGSTTRNGADETFVGPEPVRVATPMASDAEEFLAPRPVAVVRAQEEPNGQEGFEAPRPATVVAAQPDDGQERFVAPGPVAVTHGRSAAEPTPAAAPHPAAAPSPPAVGTMPDNASLYQVAVSVARRHGADHHTVEIDPQGHGVRLGIGRFSQATGELGDVLRLAHARDPDGLRGEVGGDLEQLLAVTTATDRAGRLQPVGGTALWQGDWPARLRGLTELPAIGHAQNEQSVERHVRPLVPVAFALGGRDGRSVAMLLDRALTTDRTTAVDAAVDAVATTSDEQALAQLGLDWAGIRAATPWLPDGQGRDPFARAALHARLAESGGTPLPSLAERLSDAGAGWAAALASDAQLRAIRLGGAPG